MLERPCSIISIPISINFDEEFESDAEDQIRKDDSMFHRKKIVFECLFEPEEPEPYLSRSDHRILNHQQNRSQKALPQQQPQRPQQPQQQQQLALSTGRIEPLPLYRKSLVSFDLSQPQPPSKSLTQSLPPLPPKSLSSTLPRPKSIIKNARGPFPPQQQQDKENTIFSQQQARKSTSSILKNCQSRSDFTGHQRSISTMSVNRNFQHLTTFNGQCNGNSNSEAARYGTSAKRANIESPLTKSAVTLNFSLDKPQPLPKLEEIKQPMTRSTREPLAESTTDDEKSNNGALIEQIFRDLLYLYMLEKHI